MKTKVSTFDDLVAKQPEQVIVQAVCHKTQTQLSLCWSMDRRGNETTAWVTSWGPNYQNPLKCSSSKEWQELRKAATYYDALLEREV